MRKRISNIDELKVILFNKMQASLLIGREFAVETLRVDISFALVSLSIWCVVGVRARSTRIGEISLSKILACLRRLLQMKGYRVFHCYESVIKLAYIVRVAVTGVQRCAA